MNEKIRHTETAKRQKRERETETQRQIKTDRRRNGQASCRHRDTDKTRSELGVRWCVVRGIACMSGWEKVRAGWHTLWELELPRLLAPASPAN